MSGGSYDYLYRAYDLDTLVAHRGNLERMATRLAELGYAQDAAGETLQLVLQLRVLEVNALARIGRLEQVWKAVEWWASGDGGEDELREALEAYRTGGAP